MIYEASPLAVVVFFLFVGVTLGLSFFLGTQAGQPGLGPGLTGTSTRSEAEILAGWWPDPWTCGLASKPW